MRFNNAKEMLDVLQSGIDLYSPEAEIYAFIYNSRGAIAYYGLVEKEARKLADMSKELDEVYWGAFLGRGGLIIEPEDKDYDWFSDPTGTVIEEWIKYEWIDTSVY